MDVPKTSLTLWCHARIACPNRSLAGPNEPGELLIHRGSAALGYKGNVKVTQETFVDRWMHTGDRM